MKKFELPITLRDWIFIKIVAILFSSTISLVLYLSLNLNTVDGLITGAILGVFLTLTSFVFISISNRFILPLINQERLWWIISAVFSFLAGFTGFFGAYSFVKNLSLEIPPLIESKITLFSVLTGILNYLIGLLIFLFINARTKRTELENLLTESRLLALNTQLNSHFLFNVINSIVELINIDKERAEEALIKLSKFLRKVLKERDLIPLREEIENVKTYIELENLRYNQLIKFRVFEEESIPDINIPKFSVQLIVENAIKHGFTGKELEITVFVEELKEEVKIHISNNGKLPEEIKFGTGLKNLIKRVKILCNGTIEYRTQEQVEFIINLPR